MHNWLRYAGNHVLELKPTVYGIVAEWLGEEGRSNMAGKSALMEAFDFALTGNHRHRTEDQWITTGEDRGSVALTLSDDVTVCREREFGKATRVTVELPGGAKHVGKEAERYIAEQVLGCTREDFYLLYYARQKALAEIVSMTPEAFADTIRQWVGTGPLETVEAEASRELGQAATRARELEQTIIAATADVVASAGVGDGAGVLDPVPCITAMIRRLKADKVDALAAVTACQNGLRIAREAQQDCNVWCQHEVGAQVLDGTRAELAQVRKQITGMDGVQLELDEAAAQAADEKASSLKQRDATTCRNLEELARGKFDGTCPVMNAACPARDHVLKAGIANKEKLLSARELCNRRAGEKAATSNALAAVRESMTGLARLESKAEALEAAIERASGHQEYLDANEAWTPESKLQATQAVVDAESKLGDARVALSTVEQSLARVERRLGEVERAVANIDGARAMMARYNRIRRAAGRQGAQREIALGSMRRVERLGNSLLSEASVPLSFKVRWTSEGKKLGGACDACGHVYTGQRDKACPRCKAERQMHAVDRPGLELSERSGAAEDLVGAAVRLGASAWLRRKRSMGWSVSMIDEPLGSLDAALRETFAQYLVSSLRGRFGFEQAFVITHSPEVNAAFPGLIKVVGAQHGSRAEVVY